MLGVETWVTFVPLVRSAVHLVLIVRRTVQTSLFAEMVESYASEAKVEEVALAEVSVVAWQERLR